MKRQRVMGGLARRYCGGPIGLCAAAAFVGAFVMSGCGGKRPAGVADVLDLAPADTTIVLVVDFKKLTESGVIDKLEAVKKARDAGQIPLDPKKVDQLAMFIVADPDKPDKSKVMGVITHSLPPKDVQDQLKKSSLGATVKVGDMTAYKTKNQALATAADDKTVLFGNSQDALAQVCAAYKKKTPGPANVKAAMSKYQKSQVRFAVILSDKMKAKGLADAGKNAPKYLSDASQVAGGLDITAEKVYLEGAATFAKAASAKQAADDANKGLAALIEKLDTQIEQAKKARDANTKAMVPAMQAALSILKSVKISANAADLELSMGMALTDIQEMTKLLPLLLMQAMMGGGGGSAPPPRR